MLHLYGHRPAMSASRSPRSTARLELPHTPSRFDVSMSALLNRICRPHSRGRGARPRAAPFAEWNTNRRRHKAEGLTYPVRACRPRHYPRSSVRAAVRGGVPHARWHMDGTVTDGRSRASESAGSSKPNLPLLHSFIHPDLLSQETPDVHNLSQFHTITSTTASPCPATQVGDERGLPGPCTSAPWHFH